MNRFIYGLLITFGILTLLYVLFIAVIDPFYVFHMPVCNMEPLQTDKAHYVARGLIRNADYDLLICGSSMCENFHIDRANEIFYGGNGKCLKVLQHGSYSKDLAASLEAAADAGKADVIIMSLDIFRKSDEEYRMSDIPSYAIKKSDIFNICPYLLNKDIFRYAVDLIIQNRQNNVPPQNDWWIVRGDMFSEENCLAAYKTDILDKGFSEFDETKAWNNLKNIETGVEACQKKDIEIKFFIPPYSIAWWDCKDYKAELMTYREIWKELLKYSNVSIYAVQFDSEIITDFSNYRNSNHYSEDICNIILQDIKEGKNKLEEENIDDEIEHFIELLDGYDWSALRNSVHAY